MGRIFVYIVQILIINCVKGSFINSVTTLEGRNLPRGGGKGRWREGEAGVGGEEGGDGRRRGRGRRVEYGGEGG